MAGSIDTLFHAGQDKEKSIKLTDMQHTHIMSGTYNTCHHVCTYIYFVKSSAAPVAVRSSNCRADFVVRACVPEQASQTAWPFSTNTKYAIVIVSAGTGRIYVRCLR